MVGVVWDGGSGESGMGWFGEVVICVYMVGVIDNLSGMKPRIIHTYTHTLAVMMFKQ